MSRQHAIVTGYIRPDGSIEVAEKVNLPPGPAYVTVQKVSPQTRKGTLQVLREIWAERQALGLAGRSKEEVDAEINAMRDADEGRPPLSTAVVAF